MTKNIKRTKSVVNSKKNPFELFEYEKDNEYLSDFLKKNKTQNGYKRITLSPLRYAGGKSKAIGLILENLPKLKEKRLYRYFLVVVH